MALDFNKSNSMMFFNIIAELRAADTDLRRSGAAGDHLQSNDSHFSSVTVVLTAPS